jgi:hypothetical protein
MKTIAVIFIASVLLLGSALIFTPIKTTPIDYQGAAINTRTGDVMIIALVPVPLKQASPSPNARPVSPASPTPNEANGGFSDRANVK